MCGQLRLDLESVSGGRGVDSGWIWDRPGVDPGCRTRPPEAHVLVEAPLVADGGVVRGLPVGACSGPPLSALIDILGPAPE